MKTPDGRDIYFHRNSVLDADWERLDIGTKVRFTAELGQMGPQASTVQIVAKPGAGLSRSAEPLPEAPAGREKE